ncbi:MAG: hypothetical protein HYW97_01485 [Candidatus Wildermuthbacteria bacterium]|nr:hypothetical protein [Candidatus Wildermuthbacteria bacterium]
MKRLKVGIIGPTNMEKLTRLTKKPRDFFLKKAEELGKILAVHDCELWVNSDGGMPGTVALAYKKYNGKALVVLYPQKSDPWPNKHTQPYRKVADKVSIQPNWFWANYEVVSAPAMCICVGLSAGTLSELAYIKWNIQFQKGNLKDLVVIEELVRGKVLPPEIGVEVRPMVTYLKKTENLDAFLEKLLK